MTLLTFPSRLMSRGTVHVLVHDSGGYDIGHESSSGGSWGSFSGPYQLAETAIAAAHQLAREAYGCCAVEICRTALLEIEIGSGIPNHPSQLGDF